MAFTENISFLLSRFNITIDILSEELKMSYQELKRLVKGNCLPSEDEEKAIAKYFCVKHTWIIKKHNLNKPHYCIENNPLNFLNWKSKKTIRKCLKCNKKFKSKHIANRLCDYCKHQNKDKETCMQPGTRYKFTSSMCVSDTGQEVHKTKIDKASDPTDLFSI